MRNFLRARVYVGLRHALISILCFQFIFPSHVFGDYVALYKELYSVGPPKRPMFAEPLWDLIQPYQLPQNFPIAISDPILDEDPFFLRKQSWSPTTLPAVPGSEVSFKSFPRSLEMSLEGTAGTLHIGVGLTPVASLPEWILLKANDRSLFPQGGEGLFAIAIQDMISASQKEKRVPVFFIPMPGSGWTGEAVQAVLLPEDDMVAVRTSDGDVVPIELSDIRTCVQVGQANLMLALALGMRGRRTQASAWAVPSKSTAGFGLFFTGIHLEAPQASLVKLAKSNPNIFREVVKLAASNWWHHDARAVEWMSIEQILEQVVPKLSHVGTIVGLALAAAVVFKYTLFRSRFVPNEKKFHPWREFGKRQAEAWKNNLTLFGQNVGFLATLPYIFPGNAIQFVADRYFPKLASADNSIVRKLLNFFVGAATDMNRDLQVNDRVVKGALTTTAIDTLCVAYQLYFVVPQGLQQMASVVPAIQPRVDDILSKASGEAARTFALEETIYVTVNHLTRGPADYASDIKAQALQLATIEIDEEMRNDPKHQGWEQERARRIEARVALKYREAGVGEASDFLYDAQTVYTALIALLGYGPQGVAEQIQDRGRYEAQNRYGLVIPALKLALKNAEEKVRLFPSDSEGLKAVTLLRSLLYDATYFEQFVKNPANLLREIKNVVTKRTFFEKLRKARRELLMLTSTDALTDAQIRNLPESWQAEYGPAASRVAATIYQNSFFALVSGDNHLIETTATNPLLKEAEGPQILEGVTRTARQILSERHGVAEDVAEQHPIEFSLLVERLFHAAWERFEEVDGKYSDPVKGWFSKWQVSRAKHKALKAFTAKHGKKFDVAHATPEEHAEWQRIHAKEMMAVMGMKPVYDDPNAAGLQEAVEQLAESRFSEFARDAKVREYLSSRPDDAHDFLDRMRAIFTAQSYLDITTRTNLVPASSEAQPGVLQGLRNSWIVRKLPKLVKWPLTVTLRFFEAATYSEGHHLGFGNFIKRVVPFLTDLKLGAIRTMQVAVLYLSFAWAFNYLFWKIEMPWYLHASSFFLCYPLVVGPRLFLQRAFKNIGMRPTHTFGAMSLYALAYSWATFLGYFPTQFFEPESKAFFGSIHTLFASGDESMPSECATQLAQSSDVPPKPE